MKLTTGQTSSSFFFLFRASRNFLKTRKKLIIRFLRLFRGEFWFLDTSDGEMCEMEGLFIKKCLRELLDLKFFNFVEFRGLISLREPLGLVC